MTYGNVEEDEIIELPTSRRLKVIVLQNSPMWWGCNGYFCDYRLTC